MKLNTITNYVFVLGLIVLLLNDHFLKSYFHNNLTGKISDFAGILIFPMLLTFLFPINTKKAVIATILFFVYWKSSLSQPLIDFINSFEIVNYVRIVDYTDFIAFLILPVTTYVLKHIELFEIKFTRKKFKNFVGYSLLFICSVTFMATSNDDDTHDQTFTEHCCNQIPISKKVGNGMIYIPSIFTPDNNGVNDIFQISIDSNIVKIDTFLISREIFVGGRNKIDTVFNKTNITEITSKNGFDGKISDSIPPQALYQFTIVVSSKDSITKKFTGNICAIPCQKNTENSEPDNFESCAFSSQFDPKKGYDPNIEPDEDISCFD
ncbi:hypothetical protein ABW636_10490 [Aquimarina sp. 2201CG1-2-11]|uniref:hypothetical protein n=1 Tax=Aquimarina discodermiae TaxID=3231043 RepID=UPI00346374B5